jgi:hypothetical protein
MKLVIKNHKTRKIYRVPIDKKGSEWLEEKYGFIHFLRSHPSDDLATIVRDFAEYLSNHHLEAYVENEIDIQKSEKTNTSLQKMSRPRITFPNFPKVTTRPDQEVQPIETNRQRDIFSRKAIMPHFQAMSPVDFGLDPDSPKYPQRLKERKEARDRYREGEIKNISESLDRKHMGVNIDTPKGPKSTGLTGKRLASQIGLDTDYQQKLKEHNEKRNQIIRDYNQRYKDWVNTYNERSKGLPTGSPELKQLQDEMAALKPQKPKLPRAPAKRKDSIDMKSLSPENYAMYGRTNDMVLEHEGFHHTMDQLSHKYGKNVARKALDKIIDAHDKDALRAVGEFISENYSYKPTSDHFDEEVIAHARDLLVNPRKRKFFEEYYGDKAKDYISKLKAGHERAVKVARTLKPEDFENKERLASSEEMKKGAARRIFGRLDPNKLPGRDKVNEWQQSVRLLQDMDSSYDDEAHRKVRSEIPEMEGGLRLRALNKLSNKTLTRIHPETGKRQFLLFRGVSGDEKENVLNGGLVRHDEHTSWTPHIMVARGFEEDYDLKNDKSSKTIAAWIDEDKIHSVPYMYGKMPDIKMGNNKQFYTPSKNKPGKNEYSFEREIIVAPHTSDRATKDDVKRYYAIHTPTRTKMAQTDPKRDLDARINYRGERDKSGFRSTKQHPLMRETKPLPSSVKDIMRTLKATKKMTASEEENE